MATASQRLVVFILMLFLPPHPNSSDSDFRLARLTWLGERPRSDSLLLEWPVVLSHELAYFPCDLSYGSLSLSLVRLNGAIGQLLFDSAV
jgi:hypothetical protein